MGIGILFLVAGIVHFTHASVFEDLVPDALKNYRAIVNAVTGVLIFAMGLVFLVPRLRVAARWSAIALLIATLPTTVARVFHPVGFAPAVAAVGVFMWLFMIGLIWWATKPETNSLNA
ncbi:hypothetical protein [Paraburkholderia terrae]